MVVHGDLAVNDQTLAVPCAAPAATRHAVTIVKEVHRVAIKRPVRRLILFAAMTVCGPPGICSIHYSHMFS